MLEGHLFGWGEFIGRLLSGPLDAFALLRFVLYKLAPGECSASAGRSYSKEDVDRTGKTTASGALRLMDPSVTIH